MVRLTLVAPVLGMLSAGVSAVPTFARTARGDAGCSAASFGDFAWTLSGISYNTSVLFSTPAHQIDSGIVEFNVSNPAVPEGEAFCRAFSTQLSDFFYGNIVYNCTSPAEGVTTTFTFDAPSSTLNLTQSWTCADKDPQYPTTFTYAGGLDLELSCVEDHYQNPNWTMGQIYSSDTKTCSSPDVQLTPSTETAVA